MNIFVLPKQFPLNGMNILQAVAIGVSTDISVLIIASSTLIIIAVNTIQNIINYYTCHGYMSQLPRKKRVGSFAADVELLY